jgi:hypothetical protein
LKSQIPSIKDQINPPAIARHDRAGPKPQNSMIKTFNPEIGKRKEKRGKRIRETTDEHE